jgi:predicted Fe-S protein YdhL (DUF1289 family)
MTASATSIEPPCNRVCTLHPVSLLCVGCGRSLEEIAAWIVLDKKERARIMAQLPSRLKAMACAAVARATA